MRYWRVSQVESFRHFEQNEDAELDTFLAELRGGLVPSEAMIAGTAFHRALELAPTGVEAETIGASIDGVEYLFRFLGAHSIELPVVRELRASHTYIVDGEPITITGQVDAMEGRRIDDHKTTGRFDADRYLSGYQWRLYLDIFNASHFRWNIFETVWNDDEHLYDVTASHRLEQYRYPGMEADCHALVTRFARFVREYAEMTT